MKRLTIKIRWGAAGDRVILHRVEESELEELLAVVPVGDAVDILLDCCGEPAVFDALAQSARRETKKEEQPR